MEYGLWGVLPAAIALSAVVMSVRSVLRHPSLVQGVLAGVVLSGASWSLWVLKRIFIGGAWPTFLPHLVIVVVVVVAGTQVWLAHRVASNRPAA